MKEKEKETTQTTQTTHKRKPTKIDLWSCDDIKALIGEKVKAEVKDVNLAKRLEHLLADEVAYGSGGGGGVATV